MNYSEFKGLVAGSVKDFLIDFQSKLAAVDESAISAKLAEDEAKMAETAGQTLLKVQQAVGLRPME
jgi:hypothetical protein